jgi:hypothetical protein
MNECGLSRWVRWVPAHAGRILRLALLAPDIVDAILAGRTDQAIMLERLERPLSARSGGLPFVQ